MKAGLALDLKLKPKFIFLLNPTCNQLISFSSSSFAGIDGERWWTGGRRSGCAVEDEERATAQEAEVGEAPAVVVEVRRRGCG